MLKLEMSSRQGDLLTLCGRRREHNDNFFKSRALIGARASAAVIPLRG